MVRNATSSDQCRPTDFNLEDVVKLIFDNLAMFDIMKIIRYTKNLKLALRPLWPRFSFQWC